MPIAGHVLFRAFALAGFDIDSERLGAISLIEVAYECVHVGDEVTIVGDEVEGCHHLLATRTRICVEDEICFFQFRHKDLVIVGGDLDQEMMNPPCETVEDAESLIMSPAASPKSIEIQGARFEPRHGHPVQGLRVLGAGHAQGGEISTQR